MNAEGHRKYSLQNRLVLFTLAILLASILALALYIGGVLRNSLRGHLAERQQAVATMVAADIDKALMIRRNFLEAVADAVSAEMLGNPAALQSYLDERRAGPQLFGGGIVAIAADGTAVAEASSSAPSPSGGHGGTERLQRALQSGRGSIVPLEPAPPGSMPMIAITVPVRDAGGAVIGILTGSTRLDLPAYLDRRPLQPYAVSGDFFLVDPQADAGSPPLARKTALETGLSPATISAMLDRLAKDREGGQVFVSPAGEEVVASVGRLQAVEWQLIAALPTDETLAPVGDAQWSLVLATVLLMLVSGLLTKQVLHRELAALRSATAALASQSHVSGPPRPLPVHRDDEIGELVSAFNHLLASLAARESALRESEDRYRRLIESTAEAIWVIQDGHVKFANAAMLRMLEYPEDELKSRPFIDFVHPDLRDTALAHSGAGIAGTDDGGKRAIRVLARGGKEKWLEVGAVQISWEGRPAILNLASDVTEQRYTRLELARARELLERTSESAKIGGWRLDLESGQLHWTRETYRIHELDVDEPVTAQRALSFYTEDSRPVIAAALQMAIESGKPWDLELPMVTATGRTIWVRAQGAADSRDGRIVAVGGALQDVTARKQMESQILQSEKLAVIGQLAAGVAHEINNPIAFVNSNLGALRKYVDDLLMVIAAYEEAVAESTVSAQALERVDALREQVEIEYLKEDLPALLVESAEGLARVKDIVAVLKDFTRADSSDAWQQCDLRAGIESTLRVVWNELKYRCEVVSEYAELPPVECIPGQVNQVFMNLLVNAAHSISERGVIRLRTGREGDFVWVEVADNGRGIEPAILPRIFDPFFTTKAAGKGTGLGLSVALRIVETHQGRIDVESVPGKGTTFRVWLPIRRPQKREAIE